MADEQPQNPSAEPQAADASSAPEASSAEPENQPAKQPSWWSKLLNRGGGGQAAESASGTDSPDESAASTLSLTQEELDRRIQAETDRREAKRQQAERAKAKRDLRDKDPWAYAEEERKEEEAQRGTFQLESFVTDIGSAHDRVTLDPVFLALPKAEQERIVKLEGAGVGLEGRKLVVSESLKALEKHWKAEGAKDAERKLRNNPAFRKQVLSENRGRGGYEPELLPSGGASQADQTVSAILRQRYGIGGQHNELNGR